MNSFWIISFFILIASVIILFTIYTHIRNKKVKDDDKRYDWWSQLILSFATIIIGIPLGIYLYHYQLNYTDQQNLERYKDRVFVEFDKIYSNRNHHEHHLEWTDGHIDKIFIDYYSTDYLEDILESNVGLEDRTKTYITYQIENMKLYNMLLPNLIRIEPVDASNTKSASNLKTNIKMVQEYYKSILKYNQLILYSATKTNSEILDICNDNANYTFKKDSLPFHYKTLTLFHELGMDFPRKNGHGVKYVLSSLQIELDFCILSSNDDGYGYKTIQYTQIS